MLPLIGHLVCSFHTRFGRGVLLRRFTSPARRGRAKQTLGGFFSRRLLTHCRFRDVLLGCVLLGFSLACDPLPDCYTDRDCGNGLTCDQGQCIQPCTASAVCEGEGECHGVYQRTLDQWSVTPRCEADPICDCKNAADTCVETDGVKACVSLQAGCSFRGCDPGYECVPTAGSSSCVCSGGDCGPSCDSNNQCTSRSCEKGRCERAACEKNDDCDGSTVCVVDAAGHGSCELAGNLELRQACTSSSSCRSGHCSLVDGSNTCQVSCTQNNDCDDDEKCARDASYEASGGGTCVAESICGDNNQPLISGGVVVCGSSEKCSTDVDCPSPGTCLLGQCTCPAGTCEQSCDDADDCAPGLVCIDDTCSLRRACSDNDDCPGDQVCATDAQQWAAGKHCVDPGPAEAGARCDGAGDCVSGLCVDGRCELECQTTSDCSSGECVQRALQNGAFALLCATSSCGCSSDEVCLRDGSCTRAQSCLVESCPNGESCVAGVCRVACSSGADCNSTESCTLSTPEAAYFCSQNNCACASDEVCVGDVCVAAAECRLDSECESGMCVAGQCRKPCEIADDCDGQECLATVVDNETHLLCGSFGCGCDAKSWCDPSGAAPQCYHGTNCDDECDDGYACVQNLPANYFVGTAPLVEACQCSRPLECGRQCEVDDECAAGERCSERGTCAPAGSCEVNDDCARGQDCVVAQSDVVAATANSSVALGTCVDDACGCSNKNDVCVETELANVCVGLGQRCSVIQDSCDDGYRCDATLALCVCDDPDECGGGCSKSSDCAPDRLCERGQCVSKNCTVQNDCPEDTVCGGPTRNRCVQPGEKDDFEVCSQWFECESAYCFANNTCATPCDDKSCGGDLVCQMFQPLSYANERPICVDQPSNCSPACGAGQYCDNATVAACQPILPQ